MRVDDSMTVCARPHRDVRAHAGQGLAQDAAAAPHVKHAHARQWLRRVLQGRRLPALASPQGQAGIARHVVQSTLNLRALC